MYEYSADIFSSIASVSAQLAHALNPYARDEKKSQAEALIARIERRREALYTSTKEIEFTDYGAGSVWDEVPMQKREPRRETVGAICRVSSKAPKWDQLLFRLVRALRPRNCIELGACGGLSGAYQGAALLLNETGGELTSIEGCAGLADSASETLMAVGLTNTRIVVGLFAECLPALVADRRIDYAFVDGHHDEKATLGYCEALYPTLTANRGVLVLDDISWSPSMERAWATVQDDPRVRFAVDLGVIGVCLLDDTIRTKSKLKL